MLLSKLFVSLNRQLVRQNLPKFQYSFFGSKCPQLDGSKCPKSSEHMNPFAFSYQDQNKESLEKCPKKKQRKRTCKTCRDKDAPKPPDPIKNAAEAFKSAFAEVKREALNLQIFTRNSVNALASSMVAENSRCAELEKGRVMSKLKEIEPRINQIFRMSFVCGARQRNESYALSEKIFNQLQVWNCENSAGNHCVNSRLRQLECKVKERTEMAVEIVRTCKGCTSPQLMLNCVEESIKDALCILETTDTYVKRELEKIEKLKNEALQENSHVVQGLITKFEADITQHLKQLDECIAELRKMCR